MALVSPAREHVDACNHDQGPDRQPDRRPVGVSIASPVHPKPQPGFLLLLPHVQIEFCDFCVPLPSSSRGASPAVASRCILQCGPLTTLGGKPSGSASRCILQEHCGPTRPRPCVGCPVLLLETLEYCRSSSVPKTPRPLCNARDASNRCATAFWRRPAPIGPPTQPRKCVRCGVLWLTRCRRRVAVPPSFFPLSQRSHTRLLPKQDGGRRCGARSGERTGHARGARAGGTRDAPGPERGCRLVIGLFCWPRVPLC